MRKTKRGRTYERYRPDQVFCSRRDIDVGGGSLPPASAEAKILWNRNVEVTMSYNRDLGCVCHWCGEYVGTKGGYRTGNHVYCDNGGKCKQAHYRAFHKYQNRVTPRPPAGTGQVARSGPGGNALGKGPTRSSSREIATTAARQSNAGKRGKRYARP